MSSKNLRNIEPPEGRDPFDLGHGNPANAPALELGLRGLTGVFQYYDVLRFSSELTREQFRLALELGSRCGRCQPVSTGVAISSLLTRRGSRAGTFLRVSPVCCYLALCCHSLPLGTLSISCGMPSCSRHRPFCLIFLPRL